MGLIDSSHDRVSARKPSLGLFGRSEGAVATVVRPELVVEEIIGPSPPEKQEESSMCDAKKKSQHQHQQKATKEKKQEKNYHANRYHCILEFLA